MTADERQRIIDLYRAGTKVAVICRATGRSRYSVYAVLNDEGIDHRNAAERYTGSCEVCDAPVRYVAPSQRVQGIGRFCSPACMGKAKRLPLSKRADSATELECRSCKQIKPVDDFYAHASTTRGRQYWCKACYAERRRDRASLPADPKVTRKYKLKRSYGISQEDYDAMYERQNGCCAICGNVKEPWKPGMGLKDRHRFLVVDHDHQTSRVRALLCWNCNCGLGHFRENAAIMRAAIRYVEAQEVPLESAPARRRNTSRRLNAQVG